MPGITFTRRRIPGELVVEQRGLRFTHPSLTAIDMATFRCPDAIDLALRTRAATLAQMYEALRLTSNRIGNPERMRLLLDSRDLPWSAAERGPTGSSLRRVLRLEDQSAGLPGRSALLHRHRVPTDQGRDRDRWPAARGGPGPLRVGQVAAERPRRGRLARAALHVGHAAAPSRGGGCGGAGSDRLKTLLTWPAKGATRRVGVKRE